MKTMNVNSCWYMNTHTCMHTDHCDVLMTRQTAITWDFAIITILIVLHISLFILLLSIVLLYFGGGAALKHTLNVPKQALMVSPTK